MASYLHNRFNPSIILQSRTTSRNHFAVNYCKVIQDNSKAYKVYLIAEEKKKENRCSRISKSADFHCKAYKY